MQQTDIPAYYYIAAAVLGVCLWPATRKWAVSLLAPYAFLVLAATLLIRESGAEPKYELQLFWSYRVWEIQRGQIIANVLMFLPIGFLAGAVFGWKGVPLSLGFSAMIESLQLASCRGLFEFDDMVHNTLGAAVGFLILLGLRKSKHRMNDQRDLERENAGH